MTGMGGVAKNIHLFTNKSESATGAKFSRQGSLAALRDKLKKG
jgi:hypothetical protein